MSKQEEEEPLDPAVEAVRVKMVRLLAVSGGIMVLGLMAVLFSIVYKINQNDDTQPVATTANPENVLSVPKGAQVVAATQSDGRLTLTLQFSDGSTRVQIHTLNGTMIAGYTVREQ